MNARRPTIRALLFQRHHLFLFPYARLYTTSSAARENWASIRGEASEVPVDTTTARYNNWVPEGPEGVPESLKGPVWSGEGKDFLAYGVDLPKVRNRSNQTLESWVHSPFENPAEYLDPNDRDSMLPEFVNQVRQDLRRASELLGFLDQRGGLQHETYDRTYTGEDLGIVRGEVDLLLCLRRARQIMDERLAAINFGLLHADPEVKAYVEYTYAAYIVKWHLLDSMRGIYLDFRSFDPTKTHVLDLMQRKVPIYFPYDPEFWPPLSLEEAQAAEEIKQPAEYAQWLVMQSFWPRLSKTLPLPLRVYGRTSQERELDPGLNVPQPARYDQLVSQARILLTDALHPNLAPIVAPLANISVRIVGSARLIVDRLSEMRMMLWAVAARSSNSAEVLGEALLRGWAFQVVYPKAYLDELAQQRARATIVDGAILALPSIHSEDEDLIITSEWQLYLIRVLVLLSRPHAKAFLCLGGILWRLAILLGGRFLVSWMEDVLGPSNCLVARRSGSTVLQEYWADEVTEFERDVLLGVVVTGVSGTRRSWFPPQELLERHHYYDGEWSRLAERLVLDRYESLQRGEETCRPLTFEEWDLELGSYETGRILRDSYVPMATYGVETFLVDLRVEMGGSWNGVTLAELDVSVDLDQ